MIIDECKERIKIVLNKYTDDIEDEDLELPDIKILICEMETIINIKKSRNWNTPDDIECLKNLKELISKS